MDILSSAIRLSALAHLLALACFAGAPQQDPAEVTRVFLVAGQSNAEGADTRKDEIDRVPGFEGAGKPDPDIRYWYEIGGPDGPSSGGWIDLQPALKRPIFGPELTFAQRIKRGTRGPIAVIKSASGGTDLAVDWDPGNSEGQGMYARTLDLVGRALAELDGRGVAWKLEAVLWQQGENDMLNKESVAQYGERLGALIARLRKDLDAPGLPWFVGETSFKCIWGLDYAPNMGELRRQQLAVTGADPNVTFVPSSHLSFRATPDGPHYHFGTEGALQLGEAHARAYLRSIGAEPASAPAPLKSWYRGKRGARVRVFLMTGQRSVQGEGAYASRIDDHAAFRGLAKPQPEVLYSYHLGGGAQVSADWTALGPVDELGTFGPELSFGQFLAQDSDEPVAILKIADGAAFLVDWVEGHPVSNRPQYQRALGLVRAGLAGLEEVGLRPSLEGVLWLPAEHDAWWGPHRRGYGERLGQVVVALRRDLDAPDLRWFAGELRGDLLWGAENLAGLNAQIRELADSDPRLWLVPADGLSPAEPAATLGTLGTLEMGRAFAEAYLGSIP